MKELYENNLANYLRSLRDARGLTLRQVEENTGVSNAYLSQMESGKVKQPSPLILYKLAQMYQVPYDVLMKLAGYPVPESIVSTMRVASQVFNRLGVINEEEEQALLDYLSFMRNRAKRKIRAVRAAGVSN